MGSRNISRQRAKQLQVFAQEFADAKLQSAEFSEMEAVYPECSFEEIEYMFELVHHHSRATIVFDEKDHHHDKH